MTEDQNPWRQQLSGAGSPPPRPGTPPGPETPGNATSPPRAYPGTPQPPAAPPMPQAAPPLAPPPVPPGMPPAAPPTGAPGRRNPALVAAAVVVVLAVVAGGIWLATSGGGSKSKAGTQQAAASATPGRSTTGPGAPGSAGPPLLHLAYSTKATTDRTTWPLAGWASATKAYTVTQTGIDVTDIATGTDAGPLPLANQPVTVCGAVRRPSPTGIAVLAWAPQGAHECSHIAGIDVAGGTVLWTADEPNAAANDNTAQLVMDVSSTTAVAADGTTVFALDLHTGKQLWTWQAPQGGATADWNNEELAIGPAGVLVVRGNAFDTTDVAGIVRLDATTGAVQSQSSLGLPQGAVFFVSILQVQPAVLYIELDEGAQTVKEIRLLNDDGTTAHSMPLTGSPQDPTILPWDEGDQHIHNTRQDSAIVQGTTLVTGRADHDLGAWDLSTGKQLWAVDAGADEGALLPVASDSTSVTFVAAMGGGGGSVARFSTTDGHKTVISQLDHMAFTDDQGATAYLEGQSLVIVGGTMGVSSGIPPLSIFR